MFSLVCLFFEILVVELSVSMVNEIELMAGVFDFKSALPQYLIKAKLGCAIDITFDNLILR